MKNILISIIIFSLLLVGCGNTNTSKTNTNIENPNSIRTNNSDPITPIPTNL